MEPEATINTYTFYEKYIVYLRRKLFPIIKKIVRYKNVNRKLLFCYRYTLLFLKKNHFKFTKQCRQNLLNSR